jgi:predicted O-methyltransferase YrrM
MINSKTYLNEYLNQNVRFSSLRYIHEYIANNDVKRIIEFGTSRVNFEGNSTIFLALLSLEKDAKFTSVDINQNNIDNAIEIVKKFNSNLLDRIEFVCGDQYKYMENYTEDPAQYVYLDCDDQKKHESLKALLKSKILDSEALICIDDMVFADPNDEINKSQVYGVVDEINSNNKLTPIYNQYSDELNYEQTIWINYYKNNPTPRNFKIYSEGVHQFEYQILVNYKN